MPYTGAGSLRQQLTFSKPHEEVDEFGNVVIGWQEMFTVSANLTPRISGETVEASRLAGKTVVVITVRQSPDTRQIATDWKATTVEGPTPADVDYNLRSIIDPHEGGEQHGKLISMLAEAGVAV